MPDFLYKGRDASGTLVNGRVQAASVDAAASALLADNITPIDIRPSRGQERAPKQRAAGARQPLMPQKVDLSELVIFARQMHSLTKAGLPLDRALRGLEASMDNARLKRVLGDVAAQLEKGMDLTTSLGRHPKVFSPLFLSLVHVGENTGRLDLVFKQISTYLELEKNTHKQIKTATRYPMFVMISIALALAVITVFVIPVFAETFARFDAELPWQTQALIAASDFVVNSWHYLVLAGIAAVIAWKRWLKTEAGRIAWDARKLRLPLAGSLYRRIALSRFSRTLAMMMQAGVPIVQSLGVIARAVGNEYIGKHVLKMRDGIARGESLYQTAVKSRMFSPLVLQMIAVGEESGAVGNLLEEVADFYDVEVEYDLKRLSANIEPILIACIAGIVLVLALGVFLPIWDLASAAR